MICFFAYFTLPLIACRSVPLFLFSRTPTPTAVVVQFEVQPAVASIEDDSQSPVMATTATPDLFGSTPVPIILPTSSPTLLDTTPQSLQPEVATGQATPSPQIITPLPSVGVSKVTTPVSEGNIYTGPLTDNIVLSDPAAGYTLPAGQEQLEFRWAWHGEELRPCELPPGYGFILRLWANPADSRLPEPVRQAIEPLGVDDFKAIQPEITASCDPETGLRRYTLKNISSAPGAALVGGSGHFFWDVAYAQLEPYVVELVVSPPRDFFILPTGPTPVLPLATASPTPAFPLTPQPRPAGTISLLKPDGGAVYPVNMGPIQFEWRWAGQPGGFCQLSPGYGFELRIWSRQPGFEPLGVIDAVKDQPLVECDPATGLYSLVVPDLKQVPGVVATYKGEYHWDGQFWWDVALVSISPYRPPESASAPSSFDISLANYTGPTDWFGRPVRCSQISTWPEAEAIFLALDGPAEDPSQLDPDGNGLACDELRQ